MGERRLGTRHAKAEDLQWGPQGWGQQTWGARRFCDWSRSPRGVQHKWGPPLLLLRAAGGQREWGKRREWGWDAAGRTYLVGQPTPMPLPGPSVQPGDAGGLQGCGPASTPEPVLERTISKPTGRSEAWMAGAGGGVASSAAEGEAGQASSWAAAQAGWRHRWGAGRHRGTGTAMSEQSRWGDNGEGYEMGDIWDETSVGGGAG